mmetsp:Transcript_16570/g.34317  ORF Transcript_16570/g.34317 Transcript_16570/m.34317 type:complete len:477 (-) Transcript_16570:155-1585(-)
MLEPEFIQFSFVACLAVTGIIMWKTKESSSGKKAGTDDNFWRFQKTYIGVYLIAMFSDWLQGPYVYALYDSYGFSAGDNATLFVAGFGSSMVFGTLVGSLADRTGRKKSATLYCILYIVSCLTKHVSSYFILMIGRVTGGIATSLLFSVFESWMVCEHNKRGFDPDLLGETFGMAVFGNSVAAITAGFVSQAAADFMPLSPPAGTSAQIHVGGFCGPFDVSICCLICCAVVLKMLWPENYGEGDGLDSELGNKSQIENIKEAGQLILESPDILCCGVVCSLFEASMFIFVFQWTPAVSEPGAPKPPYGHIFAAFMVAAMLGSRIFSLATKYMSLERIGQALLGLAACTHIVPVVSSDPTTAYMAFLFFELCVGVYFPMMGTLKGSIVPEGNRSTIYNLYRVPLNLVVVGSLIAKVSLTMAFSVTTLLLLCALVAMSSLAASRSKQREKAYANVPKEAPKEVEFTHTVGAPTVSDEN